jgi:hypothetical protein
MNPQVASHGSAAFLDVQRDVQRVATDPGPLSALLTASHHKFYGRIHIDWYNCLIRVGHRPHTQKLIDETLAHIYDTGKVDFDAFEVSVQPIQVRGQHQRSGRADPTVQPYLVPSLEPTPTL